MAYGTLSTLDTLRAVAGNSITAFGEGDAFTAIEAARQAHNSQFNDMLGDFVERTTDRLRTYGTAAAMSMDEVDEFGRADAQKVTGGTTLGFPLRLFQESVQWNRKFMQNSTPAELAAQFTAAQDAHILRLQREVKRAIFKPTNYVFRDALVDNVDLNVKAFVNADGAALPLGPNGEEFTPATHNHYLARAGATLAASDVITLIETVLEHNASGQPMLYINRAQETALRAMTPNFTAYLDTRIIPAITTQTAQGGLNMANLYNRAIGIFDAAEVWVKPWVPANYMFAFVAGIQAPLVLRERQAGGGGLQLVADDEYYPLRAQTLEAEFGVAVFNRTNGAALFSGGTTYIAPVIS